MNKSNEEKWKRVPMYIDLILRERQDEENFPIAASIDIDGCIFLPRSSGSSFQIMNHCLDAFKYMQKKKIHIYIITARCSSIRQLTISQLSGCGITPDMYKELRMMDRDIHDLAEESKLEHRTEIAKSSLLLLAIGDRIGDLISENEERDNVFNTYNILLENVF